MIRIRRPRMQHMRVGQELNIPNIQHHVQTQPGTGILQHLQRLELRLRERGDDACVREAGERAHVVRVPFCVDAAVRAALEVDDAGADVLFLACAGLAFAVEVPDWLREGPEDVGAVLGEGVVDVVGGDDV